jgi:hypothetical protein
LAALGLAGLIGLISAGCGSNASSESGTASSTGTTSSGANTKLTAQEKAVKFAECIRANGVRHFPDPDSKGDFNFGVDVSREVFTKAVDACKALQPPGSLSSKRTSKQQSASLRFAQCVRDHGVSGSEHPAAAAQAPAANTEKVEKGELSVLSISGSCRGSPTSATFAWWRVACRTSSASWRVPTMPASSMTMTVGRDSSSPGRSRRWASSALRLVASMPAPSRSSSDARRASAAPMTWWPSACQPSRAAASA